ncbi:uncharacterized protein LAESUDRAFT_665426, partial [Laetiporus sulphureus 93-53]
EEVVLYVLGYVCNKGLPPIMNNSQLPRHIPNAHQAVTLTGLGLKPFDDYLRGALSIHQLCSENQSGLTLQPWQSENWNDSASMQFFN